MWEILCGKCLRTIFRYKQALEDKANCTAELQKQLTVWSEHRCAHFNSHLASLHSS